MIFVNEGEKIATPVSRVGREGRSVVVFKAAFNIAHAAERSKPESSKRVVTRLNGEPRATTPSR